MGGWITGQQGFNLVDSARCPQCVQQPGGGVRIVEGGVRSDPSARVVVGWMPRSRVCELSRCRASATVHSSGLEKADFVVKQAATLSGPGQGTQVAGVRQVGCGGPELCGRAKGMA